MPQCPGLGGAGEGRSSSCHAAPAPQCCPPRRREAEQMLHDPGRSQRVTSAPCLWLCGEKVTPSGACFTAGSRTERATALWIWICSADSSFQLSSTNFPCLLTVSLVHCSRLNFCEMWLQREGPNPLYPFCVYVNIYLSN